MNKDYIICLFVFFLFVFGLIVSFYKANKGVYSTEEKAKAFAAPYGYRVSKAKVDDENYWEYL